MAEFKLEKPRLRLIQPRLRLKSNFLRSFDGVYVSLGVEEAAGYNGFIMEHTGHFPASLDSEYLHNVYRVDVWLLNTLLLNADHFGKEMHEVLSI